MPDNAKCRSLAVAGAGAVAALLAGMLLAAPASAQTGEPIKIGYSMALTGGLAPNGKSALLAQKLWEEEINAKGGLLGRPVKLVYYDDKSSPAEVPPIYTKLLDINYFAMIPSGPDAKPAFTRGFFDVAMAQEPKPQTVAIVAADQEFSRNGADGARQNASKAGLKIVYDKTYPPSTPDFAPIVRAIQATNPDVVVICSYPPDSVGMVRAINEIGFKPKMVGGGMVGLQATAIKTQLGPLLNGFTNYDFWLPVPKMDFPGVADLIKRYQARAAAEGVDPLGYYMAPWGYAQLQVLQQAVEGTKSFDDAKLGDYIRANTFKTVVGDVKFGAKGEWAQSRVLQVQFQNIKGNDVVQFKDISTQVVVAPAEYASGKVIYPYEKAK
jgi:branched-chain amino acid transport system substrate-binding protein